MKSFVFEPKILFRVDFLSVTSTIWLMLQGGARGQNLGHFFFLLLFFLNGIIQFKQ